MKISLITPPIFVISPAPKVKTISPSLSFGAIVLAACLILSMALPVFAGSWNIELRADSNRVRVGDYLKIRTDIDISTNKPWEVRWETSDSYIASVHDKGDDSAQIKGEHEGQLNFM